MDTHGGMHSVVAKVWRWWRGTLAVMLVLWFTALCLTHTGGHLTGRLPVICIALASLAGILVGIWKGRTLEIAGWVALLFTVYATVMS